MLLNVADEKIKKSTTLINLIQARIATAIGVKTFEEAKVML